ncbi:hypothetical protein [Dyella nitratireducens]|uniref:Uncharacterized protein n=1 Tax=Dyella nitratireducens TaxID=1849580 RepID=A0ABQ1GP94_9GAMM|nr:hypothetical protein [Dyella nitratireducens]GGA47753.1 hypothetical protein GCM10010981_41160 [Dyella nitratireducens]GLQ42406.1 hypothetical protein GCM10007902_22560 [Dyella nitratireducens]
MKAQDLSKAKSPELRASMAALQRAAALARKTAIQTDTDLVIVKDGELHRLSAGQLRARKDKKA